jgi:hypothetical protein
MAAVPVDVQTARVAAGGDRSGEQSPWRTVPRTEAAATSGMPLYGIEGLAATATMLSDDNRAVRTTYRLATGQSVEVVQQRLGERPDPASAPGTLADRAGVAGVADPPVWSTRRGDLRLTVRGMTAAQLAALGDQLRLD